MGEIPQEAKYVHHCQDFDGASGPVTDSKLYQFPQSLRMMHKKVKEAIEQSERERWTSSALNDVEEEID